MGLTVLPLEVRDRLAETELAYREVGATAGDLPAGYQQFNSSLPIGYGHAQYRDDRLRDADDAPPGPRFGWPEEDFSGRSLHEGNPNAHLSGVVITWREKGLVGIASGW